MVHGHWRKLFLSLPVFWLPLLFPFSSDVHLAFFPTSAKPSVFLTANPNLQPTLDAGCPLQPTPIPPPSLVVAPQDPPTEKSLPLYAEPQFPVTVEVSGVARYYDVDGNPHAIRCAKVEVVDNLDDRHEIPMGSGFTDPYGVYQITAKGGDLLRYPNIQVRVIAEAPAFAKILTLRGNGYAVRYLKSKEYKEYKEPFLFVEPLATGVPQYGSGTDDLDARIFSVLDAMTQAGSQAQQMFGRLLPELTVFFPSDRTAYGNRAMKVLREDALAWDELFHEYGHYVADEASTNFADPITARCTFYSAISCVGKDQGSRYAWSEGWATFWAISVQVEPLGGLVQPNLPWAGDRNYDFVEENAMQPPRSFDIESVSNGKICANFGPKAGCVSSLGYASAFSTAGLLWDLQDGAGEFSKDSAAMDSIDMSLAEIWHLLNQGDYNDVGKFYNAFVQGQTLPEALRRGESFALNNIGPELTSPKKDEHPDCKASPTFQWKANGDAETKYAHNRFTLKISKDHFQTSQAFEKITTTSFAIPQKDWAALVQDASDGLELQWAIFGSNTEPPLMPVEPSPTGGFASGSLAFICDDLPAKDLVLQFELAGGQGRGGGVVLNGGFLRPFLLNGQVPGYQTNRFAVAGDELVAGTNTLEFISAPSPGTDIWDDVQFHSLQMIDDEGLKVWEHTNTHHIGDQTIQGIWDSWIAGTWGDPNPPWFWVELEGQRLTISFEYPFNGKAATVESFLPIQPPAGQGFGPLQKNLNVVN